MAQESDDSSLILQLRHDHASARGAAAYYLGERSTLSSHARFALLHATRDNSQEVRAAAVLALAKHQVLEAFPALTSGLQDASWPYILTYLTAFGAYGVPAISLTDTCIGLFIHKRPDVRDAAARTLAKVGPKTIPSLLDAIEKAGHGDRLNSDRGQIARYSFRALTYMGNQAESAIPILRAMPYARNEPLGMLRDIALLRIDQKRNGQTETHPGETSQEVSQFSP